MICIDAGHGGSDPGALGPNGRREKNDTLACALELDRQFRDQAIDTLLIREHDISVDLSSRPAIANKARCDLYVSCHRNAGGATANGAEIWLHTDATAKMRQWAARMLEGFAAAGFAVRATNQSGWPRGVKRGHNDGVNANFAVNRLTVMPSMLIELGFVTSPEDNALFDEHYKECCAAIVKSTCEYLGIRYSKPVDAPADTIPKAVYDELREKHDALRADVKALADKHIN